MHEVVEIAVEKVLWGRRSLAGAEIFDELIGLQDIRANLVAPADIGLCRLLGCRLFFAALQLFLIQFRAQHVPGLRTVLKLRTVALAYDRDAGRNVREAHGGLGLVHVLTARAAGTHGIDANVGFRDFDFDVVIDHRIDRNRRKRSVPARVRVIGRNAHKAMHAVLGLQPAVSVLALHLDGGGLDAGGFAVALLHERDLVFVLLGPARVHAQQHRRPVLAFRAARAGVDFEIGVVGIRLPGKQRFHLPAPCFGFQFGKFRFCILDRRLVLLGFAERDQLYAVGKIGFDAPDGAERVLKRGALLHRLRCLLRIVPELGVFGERIQLGETLFRFLDVKETSSAVRSTA